MFERERTDPQPDIEFDFFDESPTVEDGGREGEPPRRRRMPTRPPGGPTPSVLRLGLLIAGAILLAVILVLWVNNCRGDQKKGQYEDYMQAVTGPASESAKVGNALNELITTPGIKLPELRSQLDGLREQQAQIAANTRDLDPPGPLREEQQSLVEAMEFRVSGLDGLSEAFSQVQGTPNAQTVANRLAQQSQRLVASDVVYADLFQAGSAGVMANEDVKGVPVPPSVFVKNADLASPTAWKLIVDRLTQGGGTASGLHGNQINGVIVQPGSVRLSPSEDNTVQASDRLAFQVLVQNSGDSQETQVVVSLTLQQNPPVRKQQVIDIINPGETKTVTFRNLGPPTFETRVLLKVNVEPVSGEKNTANNTAEYNIVFTLG
jgi:hypothetical protein